MVLRDWTSRKMKGTFIASSRHSIIQIKGKNVIIRDKVTGKEMRNEKFDSFSRACIYAHTFMRKHS